MDMPHDLAMSRIDVGWYPFSKNILQAPSTICWCLFSTSGTFLVEAKRRWSRNTLLWFAGVDFFLVLFIGIPKFVPDSFVEQALGLLLPWKIFSVKYFQYLINSLSWMKKKARKCARYSLFQWSLLDHDLSCGRAKLRLFSSLAFPFHEWGWPPSSTYPQACI